MDPTVQRCSLKGRLPRSGKPIDCVSVSVSVCLYVLRLVWLVGPVAQSYRSGRRSDPVLPGAVAGLELVGGCRAGALRQLPPRYAQLCSCCWSWGRDVLDEAVCRVGRPPAQFLAPTRGPSCRAVYNRHRRPSSHCLARKQEPQHGTAEQGREEQAMAGQTTAGHST